MSHPASALPNDTAMPHIGDLVRQKMREMHFSTASIARGLQLADITVARQLYNATLRTHILWGAGLTMKHNFFADLSAIFPYPPIFDAEKEALRARIKELETEVAVLERVLRNERK